MFLVNIQVNNLKETAKNTALYLSLLTYNLFDAFTVDLNAKARHFSRKSSCYLCFCVNNASCWSSIVRQYTVNYVLFILYGSYIRSYVSMYVYFWMIIETKTIKTRFFFWCFNFFENYNFDRLKLFYYLYKILFI